EWSRAIQRGHLRSPSVRLASLVATASPAPHAGHNLWPWSTCDRQRGHALTSNAALHRAHMVALGATPAPQCGHASSSAAGGTTASVIVAPHRQGNDSPLVR